MKFYKLLFLIFFIPFFLQAQAYFHKNYDRLIIGNSSFEFSMDISNCTLDPILLFNKIDQNKYNLSGNLFSLTITFPGEGITPPKNVPRLFTSHDFILDKIEKEKSSHGLTIKVRLNGQGLKLIYTLIIPNHRPFFRTSLMVKDNNHLSPFLEKTSPWCLKITGLQPQHGGFGQPIYGNDIFMGVEFPAAYNEFNNDSHIKCWHYSAQQLSQESFYQSHPAVIGFSLKGLVRSAFFKYIRTIRPRADKPFTLYNTWYDIRNFSYDKLINTMRNFNSTLINKYGLKLNAFVIDDGWDNVHSIWGINKKKFPQGFTPLNKELKKMHSALGLWISPWNGYDKARIERINWAKAHGFKTSAGRHLCLGDTTYFNIFKQKILQYQREGQLSFYKIDGFLSICNETNHNHLPGIYSRELLTRRFIEILKALRRQDPKIFIDITVGTWLSPWWLQYADAVWMTGADFGHAEDVPAFSARDKAITFRDYTLYKDFVRDQLQFPLTNVMTHGIIKGKLNLLGGKDETLQNWMNNTVMYFARGVMMWELYLSPEVLSPQEWDVLAKVMKWAYANTNLLQHSRFIGGNPYRRQVYGYVHQGQNEALVILRNPFVQPQKFILSLKDVFSEQVKGSFMVENLYPNHWVNSRLFNESQSVVCNLQGYEVRVLRICSQNEMPPLPKGIYLKPVFSKNKEASFETYLDPSQNGANGFINQSQLKQLTLNGKRINLATFETIVQNAIKRSKESYSKKVRYTLQFSSVTKSGIKGNLIQHTKSAPSKGSLGILLDFSAPMDSLKIQLTHNGKRAPAVIKKGAEGLWYWILVPKDTVKSDLSFSIKGNKPLAHGQISFWKLEQKQLIKLGRLGIKSKSQLFGEKPAIPVQADQKRITELILKTEF